MKDKLQAIITTLAQRHYGRVVAFAVVGILLGGWAMFWTLGVPPKAVVPDEATTIATESTFARSLPTRLIIPELEIDAAFESPLGLNEDQTIEVPASYDKVGWYKHGATPGEIGPSVILGHVDSYEGPAVFFTLGQLTVGDQIFIERADGTTAVFAVTKLERYDQDAFPSELVYGSIPYAGLRLITCSGVYDKVSMRYSHNLVVYGELVTEV